MSNECPICHKDGHLEFLSNKWDASMDCWYETCSSEGKEHDCNYYIAHIDRRKKSVPTENEQRKATR